MLDPDMRDPPPAYYRSAPAGLPDLADVRTDAIGALAVLAALAALAAGLGALIYVRRRDWLRCAVCLALAAGCGYGAARAWAAR